MPSKKKDRADTRPTLEDEDALIEAVRDLHAAANRAIAASAKTGRLRRRNREAHVRAVLTELMETLLGGGPADAIARAIRSRRYWIDETERAGDLIVISGYTKGFASLRERLTLIDPNAARLTDEQIRGAFVRKQVETIEGVAARLAVDCGAFGYNPADFQIAKRAFMRLRGR